MIGMNENERIKQLLWRRYCEIEDIVDEKDKIENYETFISSMFNFISYLQGYIDGMQSVIGDKDEQ